MTERAEIREAVCLLVDKLGPDNAQVVLDSVGIPVSRDFLQAEIQVRAALAMLLAGNTRPQIRDRLMGRFGVSHMTAYRRMNVAIDRRAGRNVPAWPE